MPAHKTKLTHKEKIYCYELIDNFQSKSQAVRNAGYSTTRPNQKAYEIEQKPKIQREIERRKQIIAEKYNITQSYLVDRMLKAVDMAEQQEKAKEMMDGLEKLSKITGNWTEKKELTGKDGGSINLAIVAQAIDKEENE